MIQPTVGRVVWFRPAENDYRVTADVPIANEPLAAIVAKVHGDRLVNLCVIDQLGRSHARQNVPLLQDDDAKPDEGCFCCWMPYQKQKAAAGDGNSESAEPRPDEKPAQEPTNASSTGSQVEA